MKKKLLPLAMLAGLAGAAGTAQAVYVNTDGHGETLIYPFFSVEEGQNTYINVTNTTDQYKAVKVRFLEGQNSAEVLDFNLYLSPEDVWTGAIVAIEGGGTKVITRDNSCTVPWIPRPNAEGEGSDGVEFRTYEYQGDGGDQTVARTQEGYVELIEMGVITDPDVQAEIQHNAAGMPGDCDGLRARWMENGVSPSATSESFENPADVVGNGYWTATPNEGFAVQADQDTEYTLGGLYGYGVLINPAEGSGSAYNAVALDQFFGAAVVDGLYQPQHTNPGTTLPSLGSAYEIAQVIDGNAIVDEVMTTGWDAVSAVFMHDTLSNDFVLDAAVNADTDWVITMPTKRFYVNQGLDSDDEPNDALPPFTNAWSGGTACEVVGIEAWDREEAVTELTGDIDFSPRPPAADGPEPSSICSEVNVLTFDDASAVYPSPRIQYGMPELGFENGWVRLDFSSDTAGERELESADGAIFEGLPVTGFAVQKFINGSMDGGTLANYAWLVQHNYTRSITPSSL
ncbi:hypothetical protein [Gilvimarinus chinensis]|uniref:hypothetical protein n=1 Tax=Gilvimarinus chinensis TaxID=396005 RepID=UPI00035F51FB|nr:hypothetical protein [Gilvimarinus chinensis]